MAPRPGGGARRRWGAAASSARRLGLPGLVVLVTAAGAVGCAAAVTPTFDEARLEDGIRADLAGAQVDAADVACPSGQPSVAGQRFECTVTVRDGSHLRYAVELTSAAGAYRYELAPGQQLDTAEAARQVAADIAGATPELAGATVTCPPTVPADGGAATFDCTLVVLGGSTPLVVSVAPGRALTWTYRA